MKKILTFSLMAMGLAVAPIVMAQDEKDVTYLIQNAGFDEDLTFQADGTMKEAVTTNTSLSDRSWAYITEDNTVYAKPKSTSSQTRADGRKLEAVNGFRGEVRGWTLNTGAEFPKCEWIYFGTIPYDLASEAIPIADDGSTYLEVPERPEEYNTEDNKGALYLRAGWTNQATYSQVAKLPAALYRLEYWSKNINPNSTANATDLSEVKHLQGTYKDDGGGFSNTEWTKHEIEFESIGDLTITFGYKSANVTSNNNPWIVIDGIRLWQIGEVAPEYLLKEVAQGYIDDATAKAEDLLGGFTTVREDYLETLKNMYEEMDSSDDIDRMTELCDAIKLKAAEVDKLIEYAQSIEPIFNYIKNRVIIEYEYIPGINEFLEWADALSLDDITLEELPTFTDVMEAKLAEFWQSQEATRENPAIFTYLVQHPWFCKKYKEPTSSNEDDIAAAGLTSDDLNSEGWTVGSQSGDQHKLYWAYDRTAFQLWNTNFTGYLDVHQELNNIPNGIYSLQADLTTNEGAVGDQHIYLTSSLQQSEGYISENGETSGWRNGALTDAATWETVVTEGTVIVTDGKLTIGARSTHAYRDPETGILYNESDGEEYADFSNGGRRGSFWMTNFVLRYHGEATADEIQAATAEITAKANTLKDAMHFTADKAAVADSIAKYQSTSSLDVLNNAIALAEKSEAKYAEIMEKGKTIPTVTDSLANEAGERYGVANEIVAYALKNTNAWLASAAATYNKVDSILNVMKGYTNTYSAAYTNADKVLAELTSTSGKDIVTDIMAKQKTALTAGNLLVPDEIDKLIADLNNVIAVAKAQDFYEKNKDATDFTNYIQNANAAAVDGWTVVDRGDGPIKSGQHYLDNNERKYFDSWTASGVVFTMEQTIKNLPNGTYALKAAVRAPSEGIFLFTANGGEAKTDTTYVEIPLDYYEGVDEEENPVQLIADDEYGPIWSAVNQKHEAQGYDSLTDEELAIWNANSGKGRGWKWMTIENIAVANHTLVIGFTNNEQRTGKASTTSWYSVTDFSLTLTEKGDNAGWDGPITGINETPVSARANIIDGIYTLSGTRVATPQRGLYIIIQNGNSKKVLIK